MMITGVRRTYPYRETVLFGAVREFHNELGAGSLFAVVQRAETADHFDAVLSGDLTFGGHYPL